MTLSGRKRDTTNLRLGNAVGITRYWTFNLLMRAKFLQDNEMQVEFGNGVVWTRQRDGCFESRALEESRGV
ncbi:MAG: hypothetical protein AB2693_22610, partial [Candidatus Thiodiazotropha sp.]